MIGRIEKINLYENYDEDLVIDHETEDEEGNVTAYRRGESDQGMIFQDFQAFDKKEDVCYIPEMNDNIYRYEDFLELANNDKKIARIIFEGCDWQSPETLYDGYKNDHELIECENCDRLYLGQGNEYTPCPYCEHYRTLMTVTNSL